jgi:hypothetical protein
MYGVRYVRYWYVAVTKYAREYFSAEESSQSSTYRELI